MALSLLRRGAMKDVDGKALRNVHNNSPGNFSSEHLAVDE